LSFDVEVNMNDEDAFQEAVERAKKGDFNEHWLQQYIKENHLKLGFDSLKGPFDYGPDFRGVYKGKEVIIEAERKSSNFIRHKHHIKHTQINILIVLCDDKTATVSRMSPLEWRKHLPEEIISIDAEDFVKSTHEMRKAYALMKEEEKEKAWSLMPFHSIKSAFARLWVISQEELPDEDSLEWDVFDLVLADVAMEYIKTYHKNIDELRWNKQTYKDAVFPRIEGLVYILDTGRIDFRALSEEDQQFLAVWLQKLHRKYTLTF
jgi:hypothetical protein